MRSSVEVVSEVAIQRLYLGILTSSEVQRVSLYLNERINFDPHTHIGNQHPFITGARMVEVVSEVAIQCFSLGILTSSEVQRVLL